DERTHPRSFLLLYGKRGISFHVDRGPRSLVTRRDADARPCRCYIGTTMAGQSREATEVLEALRGRGLRMTPQRMAIVDEVMRSRGHINVPAVAARVQSRVPGVNPSTVYRTLAMLEEMGVLSHAHLEGGAEYHHAADSGHVHLTCSSCGAEDDLSLDEAR